MMINTDSRLSSRWWLMVAVLAAVGGCTPASVADHPEDPNPTVKPDSAPVSGVARVSGVEILEADTNESLDSLLGRLPPPTSDVDFYDNGFPDQNVVNLGRLLFFDKLLSGNRNISCATCHHPLAATGDGLSLGVGEGGRGLSVTRDTGGRCEAIVERIPRNAPPLFNLGAQEFTVMFFDGRVERDSEFFSGFRTPADRLLPDGLDNVLAAQAMFPVTSAAEMAGQKRENRIAEAAKHEAFTRVWELLTRRLRANPEYVELFIDAFNDIDCPRDITFVHAANAIAAFEASAWRADQSPFDRLLQGDDSAMTLEAMAGVGLFYGEAGCASCHAGTFQTDQDFHAIAMPQIGPGKGDGEGHEDFGRGRVTKRRNERYLFRTPTLRNVALTGPWGHDGAFNTLVGVVRHHLNPSESLYRYDPKQAVLPWRSDLSRVDLSVHDDPNARSRIAAANELGPRALTESQVQQLMAFLHALTDPRLLDLRHDVPTRVPSGLPLFD